MKATLLIDRQEVLKNGKYVVFIKVYVVEKTKKFPQGIKTRYVLQDAERGVARLLVDNHEPFGFHIHTKLPEEKDFREPLEVKDYLEALDLFFQEVERIIKNEE